MKFPHPRSKGIGGSMKSVAKDPRRLAPAPKRKAKAAAAATVATRAHGRPRRRPSRRPRPQRPVRRTSRPRGGKPNETKWWICCGARKAPRSPS